MSSATNSTTDLVSKVTFSPISDSTGNQALVVTIKSVIPEAEDIPKVMDTPKRSSSLDSRKNLSDAKRKNRSRILGEKFINKSTMTENIQETSYALPTSVTAPATARAPSDTPCLKHAAANISRKASDIPAEKVSLCNNCSKSMLSYIFVVQDFLDSLAKEICGDSFSQNCVQCLRQEYRLSVSVPDDQVPSGKVRSEEKRVSKTRERTKDSRKSENSKNGNESRSSKRSTSVKESNRIVKEYTESSEQLIQKSLSQPERSNQQNQHSGTHHVGAPHQDRKDGFDEQQVFKAFSQGDNQQGQGIPVSQGQQITDHQSYGSHVEQGYQTFQGSHQQGGHQSYSSPHDQQAGEQSLSGTRYQDEHQSSSHGTTYQTSEHQPHITASYHEQPSSVQVGPQSPTQPLQDTPFRRPINRMQPDFMDTVLHPEHKDGESSSQEGFHPADSVSSPFSEGVDGIVSTLSNAEREVYDAARDGAGWEGLSEAQERVISSSSSPIPSEAYVTMCRNNAEALGCLVVGTSLLLSRTSRTLCVLVSDGVSNAFRGPLSSVFHVVQCVRSMDSLGTTKLALLEQPELGVSFEKLNVWRLVQFNKCVFLNPDTLVIQNCDELFCREELSAVADIGWPDCFNSGLFVFVPSLQTFWQLLDFAEKQGSYDGGDQGLLNSYFKSWSQDISKKLSFIYNLMANVSYTYTPAFKQFGRNVKIVQFHGSFKPWHVKFFTRTGQISSDSAVHPTYVQFVHIWLNIFRISGLRQLPQNIRSYAQSQNVICAVELLRFFPLPTESEAEFFLTPPSVRLRLAERRLQKVPKATTEVQRRKSAEFQPRVVSRDEDDSVPTHDIDFGKPTEFVANISTEAAPESPVAIADSSIGDSATGDAGIESSVTGSNVIKPPDENTLPGAEVGNYQGMKAWEQGRMDYQGTASSDSIIKRLQFLMEHPK